jgi:hypothetical protein
MLFIHLFCSKRIDASTVKRGDKAVPPTTADERPGEQDSLAERAGIINLHKITIIIHLLGLAPEGWLASPDNRA